VAGKGPTWLFDLDYLTDSMNYQPVRSEDHANKHAGPHEANQNAIKRSTAKDAGEAPNQHPNLKTYEKPVDKEDQVCLDELERLKRQEQDANDAAEALGKEFAQETMNLVLQAGAAKTSSTNIVNTASTPVSIVSPYDGLSFSDPTNPDQDDLEIPALEDIYKTPIDGIFTNSSYDDEGAVADFTNLETVVNVSPIPTSMINYIYPSTLILGDPQSAVQTRNLPYGKKAIGTKWVYRNKKDERGVVVRNKARLVAQGHRQEEEIDYDEVFAPVARIESIRIFLAFASYMGFIVYQMDVKSTFLYGKIDEEVYVSQPPGFIDPKYTQKIYKVVNALYGLHQAPRAWYATLSTFLLKNGYRRGTIDKTLFIKKDKHDIILVQVYVDDIIFGSTNKSCQDKYVAKILKKFDFVSVKTASTPIETQKPLVKDEAASDVDVHLYRSMIGSLMYLTASRPDIMYLKGKPKLGLWYRRVSSFDLEAYSDSDYAGANLDRKSTTGGCQFLGRRLISWQCKKQTIVATSTTEAEYVVAANCCGQVLWIQNQMLDYGFNFMNTKIYIDNESTICIVKNPVYHSKTKHIAIRHHFIRDAYKKKLIQCAEAFLTIGDEFQEVHWVFKSHLEEIKTLVNVPVPLDHFPVNALTSKVFSFMVKKGKHFSGKVTPLFASMLVQSTEDEGIKEVTNQAKEIKHLKAQIKKLKKQAKPVITHHRAWMKSVSLKQRLAGKKSLKSNWMQKESVSKQGRKSAKAEPSVHKDPLFDELDDDEIDNMDTEDAQDVGVILNMSHAKTVLREKEKGVELKDVEETKRPRPTSTRSLLTLKPLPKIDPKDKGKKKIEEEDESDTESKDIPEAEKKFKQLARDEEMARKLIKADRLLALRLQDEEREQFTIEERAKFLHDTIATQRIFLAEQRAIAIRNQPPTRTQLRNQMMTYLKHRRIKKMNEGVKDIDQKKIKGKKTSAKGKCKKTSGDDDSDDEHRKCLKIVSFEGTLDSEIIEKKSVIARLDKVSSPDGDYLVIYRANGNFRAFNYLMEIITWRLYEACGFAFLELEVGIVIHMLVDKKISSFQEFIANVADSGSRS
ncbi:putative ribonuclease H-like domain-containing protein, partial [Tanacetum coccineum]